MNLTRTIRIIGRTTAAGCVVVIGSATAAQQLILRSPLPHAEAALVMAGAPVILERAQHAARLFREGKVGQVILTNDDSRQRWSTSLQRNPTATELAKTALEDAGVPPSQIVVLTGRFRGTQDEARTAAQYLATHKIGSVIVVTSPYHSRRATWSVRTFAPRDILVGSDPAERGVDTPTPLTWWTTRRGWREVAPEFIKFPYYWLWFSRPWGNHGGNNAERRREPRR